MKIALVCDTHWGVRNSSPVFFDYFKKSLEPFFQELKEQDIRHVIHLGDLFDQRKHVNLLTAQRCRVDFLDPLETMGIETHIIAGNHDVFYKNTNDVNSLREVVADKYKNIHVYDKPHLINIGGLDIQLLPWIPNAFDNETLSVIASSKAQVLMGHLELVGFEMFRGSVADHGMERSLFSRYDLVCSGHYHHKSTVGNVSYLGAFAEYTWSDYQDPRGFHVLDTETRQLTFHRNLHSMFHMIAYDDVKDDEIVTTINHTNYGYLKDTYVKVVVINKTNPYALDLLIDKLHEANPINITIVEDSEVVKEETGDYINEAEDTPTILSKYVEGLTLPVPTDKMKNYLRDIYTEAINIDRSV